MKLKWLTTKEHRDLPMITTPREIPPGGFLWHNHVDHCVGMGHGINGFRYLVDPLPVDLSKFERCHCGVTDLPHYKIRGLGSGQCVPLSAVLRTFVGLPVELAVESGAVIPLRR